MQPLFYPLSIESNPFSQKLTVNGLNSGETILIFDVVGRQVLSTKAQQNSVELDVENLPSQAVYFVKIGNSVSKIYKN